MLVIATWSLQLKHWNFFVLILGTWSVVQIRHRMCILIKILLEGRTFCHITPLDVGLFSYVKTFLKYVFVEIALLCAFHGEPRTGSDTWW